jgi:sulfhydrogenase subunit beta (sulfur reductase)
MASCVITADGLQQWLADLIAAQPVIGPLERADQPGHYVFARLTRPEDLVLDYTTTTIPPKKVFFPTVEALFEYTVEEPPELNVLRDDEPFVLIGVHPCDLAAIDALDAAYGHPPVDMRWQYNRQRAVIVGVDCLPDAYCFCTSMGTAAARGPSDLFLTPIDRGYLVETHTARGERIIDRLQAAAARESDLSEARRWPSVKEERIALHLDASTAQLAEILAAGGLTDTWKEVAVRCYSCGSCNTTCPTCFCFTIDDEFDLAFNRGQRLRSWDSCQLLEFAMVAGGHNFRSERWQRVRHRWHRKFLYLYRRFGRPYCTGCGRCSRACTADINLVDVTNQLIAQGRREARRG